MEKCELTGGCIFFNGNMASMPAMMSMMKSVYCESNPDKCARLMVVKAVGREKVPADLFPNQTDRAQALIKR